MKVDKRVQAAWRKRAKLWAEGDIVFLTAVIEAYGKETTVIWASKECRLGNGVVLKD